MSRTRKLFHKVSYLQYPVLLIAVYYTFKPYFVGIDTIWQSLNNALIFAGLAISLSTLQDTTTTQNELSKRIWESPRKGKAALIFIAGMALVFIISGLVGMFITRESILKEISFGIMVLGIGVIGLLKAAIEMFENHRADKNGQKHSLAFLDDIEI